MITAQNKYQSRVASVAYIKWALSAEGFDGPMTLFEIVDAIGDGAQ